MYGICTQQGKFIFIFNLYQILNRSKYSTVVLSMVHVNNMWKALPTFTRIVMLTLLFANTIIKNLI